VSPSLIEPVLIDDRPKPRPVVVMVTVSNRVKFLNAFLATMAVYCPDYPIHIHLQDPEHRADEIVIPKGVQLTNMVVTPEPLGCHASRVLALRQIHTMTPEFNTFVNVDDDVLLTEHTYWDPAVEYSMIPGTGFVLTAWSRSASLYYKRISAGLNHDIGQRILVYNGGGMAYALPTAELMAGLDPVPARFDDIWPLTTYTQGRMNYVYWGSQSVHQTVSKGGMKKYMADEPRPLLGWKYVDYPLIPGARVGGEYAIGSDNNLKPLAHAEHRAARLSHGWPMNRTNTRANTPPLPPLDPEDPRARRLNDPHRPTQPAGRAPVQSGTHG
jgi:hypothetical protein